MQRTIVIDGVTYAPVAVTPQPDKAKAPVTPAANSVEAVNALLAENTVEETEEGAAPAEAKFKDVVKSTADDKMLGYAFKIGPSSGKMWLIGICWVGIEVATGRKRFGLRFLSKLSDGRFTMTGRVQWNFDGQFTEHSDGSAGQQFIYYHGTTLPTDPAALALYSKDGCRLIKGFRTVKFEKPAKRTRRTYGKKR